MPRNYGLQKRIAMPRAVQNESGDAERNVEETKDHRGNPDTNADVPPHVEERVILDQERHLDEPKSRRHHDDSHVILLWTVSLIQHDIATLSYLLSGFTDHRIHVDFPLVFSTSTMDDTTSDEYQMDDGHHEA
jgi:hypothetical protein